MKKISYLLLILGILLLLTNCKGSNNKNATVATYKGGSLSLAEVDEASQIQLFELEEKKFQIRRDTINSIINKKVLEIESKKQNLTVDQLIEKQVKKTFTPVSEAEVKGYYNANKNRFRKPYKEIKKELIEAFNQHAKNNIRDQYMRNLLRKYDIKVLLEKPIAPKMKLDIKGEPTWGIKNAKVTLVEFSDFECPYCRRLHYVLRQIRQQYKDQITYVFKDFPLSYHQKSFKAHVALNCATKQHAFIKYQMKVFDAVPKIGENDLLQLAKSLNLNMNQFNDCLADKNGVEAAEVREDIEYGQTIGVNSTPTLFINGRKFANALDIRSLKAEIDRLLKE